ncbi:MAG: hypothetical protein A2Z01_00850 [Betaproteobacteria bacterium RBG_16_58_11]|nr:MAG: hypothetical protein A2Z01_00850 [Betaproteobacteria bacterium RBG_16_58_11]
MVHAGSRTTVIALSIVVALGMGGCDRFRNYTDSEHVQRAKDAQAKGNLKVTVIELKNALGKNPNNAEARWLLGEAYLNLEQGAAAEKELSRARELGIGAHSLTLPFAKAYLLQRQYQKILDEIQPGPQSSASNTAKLLKLRGDANWGLRHFKQACELYMQANQSDPQLPETYWGLAECAGRVERDMQKARGYLDQALQLGQMKDETWTLIGDWESAQGRSKESEAAYAEAIKLNPQNTKALFNHAMFLLTANKFDEAKQRADAIRKANPDAASALFLDGFSAYLRKDYRAATDVLHKLEKRTQEAPAFWLLNASVNYATGSLASAEQYVERYLVIYPNSSTAIRLRAKILLKTARGAEAIQVLQPLLATQADLELFVLAAEAYSQQRQYAQAAQLLEKAIALDPKSVPVQVQLGQEYLVLGETDRAIALLESASRGEATRAEADIALVVHYLKAKQYDKALASAQTLEGKQPKNPLVQDLKGSVYLAKGDVAQARSSYEKALSLQGDYVPAASRLAQLDLREKNIEAARKRFLGVLDKSPNNLQAMLALAEFSVAERDEPEYVKWLEKAAKAHPAALEPRTQLAGYYLSRGKPQQALALAREAQTAAPDNPAALDFLGNIQLAAGEKENALATFNQMLARSPNSIPHLVRIAGIQGSMQRSADARATMNKALKAAPDSADVYAAFVSIELADGKPDQALKLAKQMQQRSTLVAEGNMLEGDILLRQRRYAEAVQPYAKAFSMRKGGLTAIKLHQSLVLSGRAGEADQQLLKWLDTQPKEESAHVYLAGSYAERGLNKAAIQQYEIALARAPRHAAAMNNLAVLFQKERDPRALATAEKAYQLNSSDPLFADTLGWILMESGDLKRSAALLKQAVTSAPNSASMRYHYAVALWKGGDAAGARKELDAALKSKAPFPERSEAKALLAKL